MLKIDVVLVSMETVPVSDLFGAVGVYTVWAPGATHRPTYVGEGVILERLCEHVKRWTRNMTGTVGIIACDRRARDVAKKRARIVEAFLLELGEALGRSPLQNDAPGWLRLLYETAERERLVRVNFCGLHPYRHPGEPNARLPDRAECSLRVMPNGEPEFRGPWKVRRLRPLR